MHFPSLLFRLFKRNWSSQARVWVSSNIKVRPSNYFYCFYTDSWQQHVNLIDQLQLLQQLPIQLSIRTSTQNTRLSVCLCHVCQSVLGNVLLQLGRWRTRDEDALNTKCPQNAVSDFSFLLFGHIFDQFYSGKDETTILMDENNTRQVGSIWRKMEY